MLQSFRSNVHWLTDERPLRGCEVCDYGRDLATEPEHVGTLCRHPEVARLPRLALTGPARAFGGACGKDAKYLTIKGIEL